MNKHFCKVGRIKFGFCEILNLEEVERNYLKFSEDAYNPLQKDSSLNDVLHQEANRLKKIILNLKNSKSNNFDAAF